MARSKKADIKKPYNRPAIGNYKTLDGKTQVQFLHDYMRGTNVTLTAEEAAEKFNIKSLARRMTDLREAGLKVKTISAGSGRKVAYKVSARDVNGSRAKLAI